MEIPAGRSEQPAIITWTTIVRRMSTMWTMKRAAAGCASGIRISGGVIGVAGLCWLAGCAGPLNNEVSIGQAWLPATLDPAENRVEPFVAGQMVEPVEPSVTSLDRSNWGQTRLLVPNDLPSHQPRYTEWWLVTGYEGVPRRKLGRYPTAESALHMPDEADVAAETREGLVSPVAAAIDVVLFPIRAIAARPWQRTRTGLHPYERAPRSQVYVNEVAENRESPAEPAPMPAEPLFGDDPTTPTAPPPLPAAERRRVPPPPSPPSPPLPIPPQILPPRGGGTQ